MLESLYFWRNAHVVLSFTCPTIELNLNLLNRNLFIECKTAKSDEGKKAAANLAAYSLSIDTYMTNTEKETKLRKTGIFFQSIGKMLMI